jgi:hypothetical protein
VDNLIIIIGMLFILIAFPFYIKAEKDLKEFKDFIRISKNKDGYK